VGTRTVAISDEVYGKLRALKRPDESFSRLLDRLSGRPSLTGLAGILTREQVAVVERSVEEGRARSRSRRDRLVRR
jgi:predicted CopG family antitoxin